MRLDKRLGHARHCKIRKESGGEWSLIKEAVTKDDIKAHFTNGTKFGVPFIRPGESATILAMVDLDDHDGSVGWDGVVEVAATVCDAMEASGLSPNPYRSGGGKGINIWLAWSDVQSAAAVRAKLTSVLSEVGLSVGSGGLADGQVEVFPKQDRLNDGEFGNCAAIPRLPLDPLLLQDSENYDWRDSEPVGGVDEGESKGGGGGGGGDLIEPEIVGADEIQKMLDHVDPVGMSYDEWYRVLMAVKVGGGTREQALAWSLRDPAHVGRVESELTERKWDSFKSVKGGEQITIGTLRYLAEQNGYERSVAVVDEFPESDSDSYQRVTTKGRYLGYVVSNVLQVGRCLNDQRYPWRYTFDRFFGQIFVDGGKLTDAHYFEVRGWFDKNRWEPVAKEMVRDAIYHSAHSHESDLMLDWLNELQWDGVDRIPELVGRMGVEVSEYTIAAMRYFMSGLAARQFEPAAQCDMMVVLTGSQGLRKSSFADALAPEVGGFKTRGECSMSDLIDPEKSARTVRGKTIIVLDELRGMKREREAIKNAVTRRWEEHTPKYIEHREQYARRNLFVGTTNEVEILDDPTGARRYLPMTVNHQIDTGWIRENRNQLWAQGAAIFNEQGVAWEAAERLARDEHGAYMVEDSWTERVVDYCDSSLGKYVTVTDIMVGALNLDQREHNRSNQMRVAEILKSTGYERVRLMIDGKRSWRWRKIAPLQK